MWQRSTSPYSSQLACNLSLVWYPGSDVTHPLCISIPTGLETLERRQILDSTKFCDESGSLAGVESQWYRMKLLPAIQDSLQHPFGHPADQVEGAWCVMGLSAGCLFERQ